MKVVLTHSTQIFSTIEICRALYETGQPIYHFTSHHIRLVCCSVIKSCPTLCDPMNCSMPGFPVLHYLTEYAQTHVHWISDAISSSVTSFSSWPQSFPVLGSFPMSQIFDSGSQSIGASASTLFLPVNIQGWFPLGLISLISLKSKWL